VQKLVHSILQQETQSELEALQVLTKEYINGCLTKEKLLFIQSKIR